MFFSIVLYPRIPSTCCAVGPRLSTLMSGWTGSGLGGTELQAGLCSAGLSCDGTGRGQTPGDIAFGMKCLGLAEGLRGRDGLPDGLSELTPRSSYTAGQAEGRPARM